MPTVISEGIEFEVSSLGKITAKGSKGTLYRIQFYDPAKPGQYSHCECPGFRNAGGQCRHMKAARIAMRELAPDLVKYYLGAFWIEFTGDAAATGCYEDLSIELATAQAEAMHGKKSSAAYRLPYPRTPRKSTEQSSTPSFCYGKRECFDRTSCPQAYACTE